MQLLAQSPDGALTASCKSLLLLFEGGVEISFEKNLKQSGAIGKGGFAHNYLMQRLLIIIACGLLKLVGNASSIELVRLYCSC